LPMFPISLTSMSILLPCYASERSYRQGRPRLLSLCGAAVLVRYVNCLYGAITEALSRLGASHLELCRSHLFLDLLALSWEKAKADGSTPGKRIDETIAYMEKVGDWLGREGLESIDPDVALPSQIITIFEAARNRIPQRVFLSRWYPDSELSTEQRKARNRLRQIRQVLTNITQDTGCPLELIDMGTRTGGTEPIHPRMYEAIESSDIILIDLTGHRPNVYVEAGYALRHHERGRLIFLFCPKNRNDKVPFDLNTYRYRKIDEAADIPEHLERDIKAILQDAGARW